MLQEKKCACCKKTIIRLSFSDYLYRKGDKFYCGWNCYRGNPVPVPPTDNTCICCGAQIPEGLQVCPNCEKLAGKKKKWCMQ